MAEQDGPKYAKLNDDEGPAPPVVVVVPRRICDAVFHHMHKELRQYLDFHTIYPLLKLHNLLLPTEDHYLLTNPQITREQKIDMIVSWLPRCERTDYLTPFVSCLRESAASEAGAAHVELAELMEKMRDAQSMKYKIVITKRATYSCVLTLSILITLPYVLCLLLMFLAFPTGLQDYSSEVYYTGTIPLDDVMPYGRWWLKSMSIAFGGSTPNESGNDCLGEAAVVLSENCSSLPTNGWEHASMGVACRLYALPGSFFNVSFSNSSAVQQESPHVWITSSIGAYRGLKNQLEESGDIFECSKDYADATCFKAEDYTSGLEFIVKRPGYYCLLLTDQEDSRTIAPTPLGIRWKFDYISFNFSAIRASYSTVAPWKSVKGNAVTSVKVSTAFNFTHKNCALLRVECKNFADFVVSDFARRHDVSVLLTVAYLPIIFTLLGIAVAVHVYFKTKKETSIILN